MTRDPMYHLLFVGVGSPTGRQSTVWKIEGNRNDVYLGGRSIAGEFKTSLHASGLYRHGFTAQSKTKAKFIGPSRDRAVVKWSEPDQRSSDETEALHQLIVPASEVTVPRGEMTHNDPIIWLPIPPDGYATQISIVKTARGAKLTGPYPRHPTLSTELVDSWALENGGALWTLRFDAPITTAQQDALSSLRILLAAKLEQDLRSGARPDLAGGHLRAFHVARGLTIDLSAEFLREMAERLTSGDR